MMNLQELELVVPPPEPGALDTGPIDSAIDAALAVPDPALESQPARGETLWIQLPLAGRPVRLEVHPLALQGLVVERYCAGGWRAVQELQEAVAQGLRGMGVFEGRREEEIERSVAHAAHFSRRLAEAVELLEQLVSEALVRIGADALALAGRRVKEAVSRYDAQKARYGLVPITPEATGGRSGNDPYYSGNPIVEVRDVSPAAAQSLVEAVRQLVTAQRAVYFARAAVRASPQPGLESAGGTPGRESTDEEHPIHPDDQPRVDAAERAYMEALGTVTREPEGHLIAPGVFGLLLGKDGYVSDEPTTQAIWNKAFVHLRDAPLHIAAAMPEAEAYPYEALRERLAIPLQALGIKGPARANDCPELRAALWGSERERGYTYEPLDDESVLVALLGDARARLAQPVAADPADPRDTSATLEAPFRYRVLAELTMARDARDQILAARAPAAHGAFETVDRVSGVLGLLGLALPPAALASSLLGLYSAAGSALVAIEDVRTANRAIDARAVGALLSSDGARYALLLASRPSAGDILFQLLGELAAFHALGSTSREMGVMLQIYFDLRAIAPRLDQEAEN